MPFRIQRVPQGLNSLLSIFGGATPVELEDRVRASLEVLQFYGLQQLQNFALANAAALAGGPVNLHLTPGFPTDRWFLLFSAAFTVQKTATMTALRGSIILFRAPGAVGAPLINEELGPFGATETGQVAAVFTAPFPLLCPPGTRIVGSATIIGTDANASVVCSCELGVL